MKRSASLILCALILAATLTSALAGCGSGGGGFGEIRALQPGDSGKKAEDPPPAEPGDNGGGPKNDKEKPEPAKPDAPEKPTPQPPPPQPEEPAGGNWAAAYLGVIDELITRYGEGKILEGGFYGDDCLSGVGIVRLIDFDGDGDYELYCAYSNGETPLINKQVIYGYDGRLVTIMEERDVSNPGTDVSPSVTFLYKYGIVFLVQVNQIVDGKYYALEHGRLLPVFEYYYDFWDETYHSVNGTPVSEDDLMYAISEMEAGGVKEHIDFYDIDGYELGKTWDAIGELIALS